MIAKLDLDLQRSGGNSYIICGGNVMITMEMVMKSLDRPSPEKPSVQELG